MLMECVSCHFSYPGWTNSCLKDYEYHRSEIKNTKLRPYHAKELSKVKQPPPPPPPGTRTEAVEPLASTWSHFESLSFLRDIVVPRKTVSAISRSRVSMSQTLRIILKMNAKM